MWSTGKQQKKTAGVTPPGIERQKNKCDLKKLKLHAIETMNGKNGRLLPT